MTRAMRQHLCALLLASVLGMLLPAQHSVADDTKVSGTCNVTLVRSTARDIKLSCDTDNEEIKRLQASVNQLVKNANLNDADINRLLKSLNDMLGMKTLIVHQSSQLDRIVQLLEDSRAGAQPDAVVGNVERVVKDTLARNVQRIGPFLITLTRIEASYGQVTIHFDVVNEGITNVHAMWFGGGSFGNGGSTIIARGQRILASSVTVGGMTSQHFASQVFIPGVHMEGRVDFRGVSVGTEDIDIFELGYSQQTLRPQVMATFRING